MNPYLFGIAAGALSVTAFVPYIRAIIKGRTKPSGASWWSWALLSGITVTSSWFAGAPLEVLILPIWLCFSQLLVAILSVRRGDNNWDWLNKACVIGACVGMGLWWITGQPLIALAISILADFLASVPNFRHAWTRPSEENQLGWTLGWGSAVMEIFAVTQWSLAESGWATYFLISMTITLVFVWRPTVRNLIAKNI
jgi:hypothetical protein